MDYTLLDYEFKIFLKPKPMYLNFYSHSLYAQCSRLFRRYMVSLPYYECENFPFRELAHKLSQNWFFGKLLHQFMNLQLLNEFSFIMINTQYKLFIHRWMLRNQKTFCIQPRILSCLYNTSQIGFCLEFSKMIPRIMESI